MSEQDERERERLYRYAGIGRDYTITEAAHYLNERYTDHFYQRSNDPIAEGAGICGACGDPWPCESIKFFSAMADLVLIGLPRVSRK